MTSSATRGLSPNASFSLRSIRQTATASRELANFLFLIDELPTRYPPSSIIPFHPTTPTPHARLHSDATDTMHTALWEARPDGARYARRPDQTVRRDQGLSRLDTRLRIRHTVGPSGMDKLAGCGWQNQSSGHPLSDGIP